MNSFKKATKLSVVQAMKDTFHILSTLTNTGKSSTN